MITITDNNSRSAAHPPRIRMTRQRDVILAALRSVCTHPTADEVYAMVRERLPRISLGTVYRNLQLLAECGKIRMLVLSGAQKRFDGRPEKHYHVRCVRCGRIGDLMMDEPDPLDQTARSVSDFQILGHRLEFEGVCPACRGDARVVEEKGQ